MKKRLYLLLAIPSLFSSIALAAPREFYVDYSTGSSAFEPYGWKETISSAKRNIDRKLAESVARAYNSWSYVSGYIVTSSEPIITSYAGQDYSRTKVYYQAYYLASMEPINQSDLPEDIALEDTIGTKYSDDQCKAKGTFSGAMPSSDGVGVMGGCFYNQTGVGAEDGNGNIWADWEPYGSTGDPDMPPTEDDPPRSSESDFPDYLKKTNNPSSCPSGSATFSGQSYCVDQSAIDTGRINGYTPPPPSGGSSGSDSSSGSTGGDSGSGGSTGSGSGSGSSAGGSGSGGGIVGGGSSGSGTDLSGVISAINSVRDSIRNGFDGLADSITDGMQDRLTEEGENPDDLVEDAGIDDAFDEMERSAGSVNGRLENLVKGNEIGSGADSGLTDQLKGYLPSFGGSGGCTPLQFFPGEIYAFTVDCVVFDKAKLYLSWLLYVWTVYTILDIFFATAPRRA